MINIKGKMVDNYGVRTHVCIGTIRYINGSDLYAAIEQYFTENPFENSISLFHFKDEINDSLSNATVTNSCSSLSSCQLKFWTNSLYLDGSSYVKIDLGSITAYTIEFWAYTSASNTSGSYTTLFRSECNSSLGGTYMHVDDGSYSTYPVDRVNDEDPSSNNGIYGSVVF